jgi:hypothetical protein
MAIFLALYSVLVAGNEDEGIVGSTTDIRYFYQYNCKYAVEDECCIAPEGRITIERIEQWLNERLFYRLQRR